MMEKKHLTRTSKVILGISIPLVVLLLAAGITLILYQNYLKEITPIPNSGLQIEAGTDELPAAEQYFSYLGSFDPQTASIEYISRETGDRFTSDEDGQTLPVGSYTVSLRCEGWDEPFLSSLMVNDTTPPVLSLKDVSIEYGGSYSEEDFLESCSDNTGEDCDFSFTAKNADGETVDMPSPTDSGTYTVTVTATDASGNRSSAEATLSIGEKPVPKPEPKPDPVQPSQSQQPQTSPNTPYSISINRAQNTVTILQLNENNEYVPFKAFVCSAGGGNTPLGNFKLGQRYVWLPLYGGVYGQYTIRIHGSIAFHSVPYYTQNKSDLEYEEYNKLGSTASAGCVRLCVQDVKWIYDNCEAGTPVTIYDGDDPGPLGKPTPINIDVNSPNRGWNPTDPDPANPWNQS